MKDIKCIKCECIKSLDLYPKNTSKTGLSNICKSCHRAHKQIYYQNNKEKIKKRDRDKYIKNTDNIKIKVAKYQKSNRGLINSRNKRIYDTSPQYRLQQTIRRTILRALFNNKELNNCKTKQILGCSIVELRAHIESKFDPWMNWNNHGNQSSENYKPNTTWDIDHIIPVSSAKSIDDVIKLNHYTNLRPLCSVVNRWGKKDKIPHSEVSKYHR